MNPDTAAAKSVRKQLDELVIHLRDVVVHLPDEGHDGWCRRAVDSCYDAADWIEELSRKVLGEK